VVESVLLSSERRIDPELGLVPKRAVGRQFCAASVLRRTDRICYCGSPGTNRLRLADSSIARMVWCSISIADGLVLH
jgi:hypothetical protein